MDANPEEGHSQTKPEGAAFKHFGTVHQMESMYGSNFDYDNNYNSNMTEMHVRDRYETPEPFEPGEEGIVIHTPGDDHESFSEVPEEDECSNIGETNDLNEESVYGIETEPDLIDPDPEQIQNRGTVAKGDPFTGTNNQKKTGIILSNPKLMIQVKSAEMITDFDTAGTVGPYCKININNVSQETTPKDNTGKTQIWNETLEFDISDPTGIANIEVLDKDTIVGSFDIALKDITSVKNLKIDNFD